MARNEDWEVAYKQGEEVVDTIDDLPSEVRDKAESFFESVRDSVIEVMETIERTERVTAKQQKALDSWEAGVRRWIRDD